jgi:uncharacterized protein YjdB
MPFRDICENLGMKVYWDLSTSVIVASPSAVTSDQRKTLIAKAKSTLNAPVIPVKSISCIFSSYYMFKGDSVDFKSEMSFNPSNASVKRLLYSSSNTSVATVNTLGKITAKKAGTVNITIASNNGKKFTIKVTVVN